MQKLLFQVFIFLLLNLNLYAYKEIQPDNLFSFFDIYKENYFINNNFKHKDIEFLIKRLENNTFFNVNKLGESIDKKSIYGVKIGNGKTKVILWSQMHGDEATATMVMFDLFNFFSQDQSDLRKLILKKLTLLFIPMLNPDGADRHTRRNLLDIDINRDAIRLTCPESLVLMNSLNEFKPEFAFNLHDQNNYYGLKNLKTNSTLSFLSPSFDYEKNISDSRQKSMQVIVSITSFLNNYLPNRISKYTDEFEERAFGDKLQTMGISSILIESGFFNLKDTSKFEVRKFNFIALLKGLESISAKYYQNEDVNKYAEIPENLPFSFLDLIIKNGFYNFKNQDFKIDLGVKINNSFDDNGNYIVKSRIVEVGDLSVFNGHIEIDAENMNIISGTFSNETIYDPKNMTENDFFNLLKKGISHILVKDKKLSNNNYLNFVYNEKENINNSIYIGNTPNFFLKDDNNEFKIAVINGNVIKLN